MSATRFVVDRTLMDRAECWDKEMFELLGMIRRKARDLEANTIVGLEITLDPFAEVGDETGLKLHAVGTAAILVPLFAGVA